MSNLGLIMDKNVAWGGGGGGRQKYKILDKMVYNSPSVITSRICNTS